MNERDEQAEYDHVKYHHEYDEAEHTFYDVGLLPEHARGSGAMFAIANAIQRVRADARRGALEEAAKEADRVGFAFDKAGRVEKRNTARATGAFQAASAIRNLPGAGKGESDGR